MCEDPGGFWGGWGERGKGNHGGGGLKKGDHG